MPQTILSLTSQKGGVGKSTLAVNLAGALSLSRAVALVDEDPIRSCAKWAARAGRLPYPVFTPDSLDRDHIRAVHTLIVDTEGRPPLEDLLSLTRSSTLTLIPCGTSGLELDATSSLWKQLERGGAALERVRVVITKVPPVGAVGKAASAALARVGVNVCESLIRHYSAHQRAAELGVLVRDVPDPRAAQAWGDVLKLAQEIAP